MEVEVGDNISREVGYIGSDGGELFSWLHYCLDSPVTDTAVIICPPLGIDYMNSHRATRHIADGYARAGIPALRFDYLGTGDSNDGDEESNQLEIQLNSIQAAFDAVKRETGCGSVGLFGFRQGATLAALFSQLQQVEFLALWAPVVKGRQLVREIKLLQQMNTEQEKDGFLEAGGLVLNPATEKAWGRVDLFKAEPVCRRILLVPADEVADEEKICEHWRCEQRKVTHLRLPGSTDMLVDAHFTRIPSSGIRQLVQHCASELESCSRTLMMPPRVTTICIPQCGDDGNLRETAYTNFEDKTFYLITESARVRANLPLIVFLNSGSNHHVGPNRLYVTLSRQLAHLGFVCARVDLPGLGDAVVDDPELENVTYIPELSDHIYRLITTIMDNSEGGSIVIAGLCSGAYGAFASSVELTGLDIVEGMMINPLTFFWGEGMSLEGAPSVDYQDWHWYMRSLRQGAKWRKLLRGDVNFRYLSRSLWKRAQLKLKGWQSNLGIYRNEFGVAQLSGNLPADLAQAASNNVHLSLILADGDPGLDILMTNAGSSAKAMINNDTLSVYLINNADHTFSMKPSRNRAISVIVEHLTRRYISDDGLAKSNV